MEKICMELVRETTSACGSNIEFVREQIKAWDIELESYVKARAIGKIFKSNIMLPLNGLRTLVESQEKGER